MDNGKPKVEILFGAGASAFSERCSSKCPPLGKDLYVHMRDRHFIPPGLPTDVIEKFESDDNFENGMQLLASYDNNVSYVPLLRNMARFFCSYIPSRDNLYHRLFEHLQKLPIDFHITTLNYENLADHCKVEAGFSGPICKPHGSCGFLPQQRGNTLINPTIRGITNSPGGALIWGCPIERVVEPVAIRKWLDDPVNDWLPPAMSFYSPTKQVVTAPEVIRNEQRIWSEMVAQAHQCLIIGTACNPGDRHIWEPLATAHCEILFINPDDAGFSGWKADAGRRKARHRPIGFEQAIPLIGNEYI